MAPEQDSPQWAQNFNAATPPILGMVGAGTTPSAQGAATPPIPDFVGAGGESKVVGSGLERVSKVIEVVAFQV